jgi:hypothetical protein
VGGEEVRGGVRGGTIDAEDGGAVGSEEEATKWSYRGERKLGGDYGEHWDSRGGEMHSTGISIGATIEQRTWSQTRELEDSQSFEGWI